MGEGAPLRLLAEDAEDLGVISAMLQDAVTRLGDIRYEPKSRRLTLALNRLQREAGGATRRVRSGLQFGDVAAVRSRRLRRDAPEAVVALLALRFDANEAPAGKVTLLFAGDADLELEVDCIDVVLADVSDAWPARGAPDHGLD
ncbi:MAG: DUF2948 family protein [Pseudomonadota bacterium]